MKKLAVLLLIGASFVSHAAPQSPFMTNVYGRESVSLDGTWNAIIDPYQVGEGKKLFLDRKATDPAQFYEYSWDGGLQLEVPGDWNHQAPELLYYEGTVWYSRHFDATPQSGRRQYLYFAAVSYRCRVYLNGEMVATHEGSFTPFQVEVTDILKSGDNFLCVEVSNTRTADAIPAMSFDWWNYGGITRDVMLVSVPDRFVYDYALSLDAGSGNHVNVSVTMSDPGIQEVTLTIPELKVRKTLRTDSGGYASASVKVSGLVRWNPGQPKLYDVTISSGGDSISEQIGFRTLSTDGTKILVNGKPVFMRSISFHEEIAPEARRAVSQKDAEYLLGNAAELGVNMVRLAHYPQNEYIERLADRMGIIIWEEIPLWQSIDFTNASTREKAIRMYKEMIWRDRNRCAVCFWGVANETRPGEVRDAFLTEVLESAKAMDDTRLFAIANDVVYYRESSGKFEMDDPFTEKLDVVGVNKYMGWYAPWPLDPKDCIWDVAPRKPLIITEFGAEAMYGVCGNEDWADSWSEDYQAKLYRDNLTMFANIPNLAGISPWVLFDFRSPYRFHPTKQEGWNRKGVLSDKGEKKKSWYIINEYYKSIR